MIITSNQFAADITGKREAVGTGHFVTPSIFDERFLTFRAVPHEGASHGFLDRVSAIQILVLFHFFAVFWKVI